MCKRIPLGVVDTMLLENLSHDGNGRINRVRDNKHERLWGGGSDTNGQILDNASVDLTRTLAKPVTI